MATRDGSLDPNGNRFTKDENGWYILEDAFGVPCGKMWRPDARLAAILFMLGKDEMGEC